MSSFTFSLVKFMLLLTLSTCYSYKNYHYQDGMFNQRQLIKDSLDFILTDKFETNFLNPTYSRQAERSATKL